ncbi:MAG: hypothetical protein P4L53_03675 [Candidatus Obscuribacterales bacterium]|nr:hypothetical protein [Candidatus Obscuribacterales bacterium]
MIHVEKQYFSSALLKLGMTDEVAVSAEKIIAMLSDNSKLSHLHVSIENRLLLLIEDTEFYVDEFAERGENLRVKPRQVIASADLLVAVLREVCSCYRSAQEPARAVWIEQLVNSITAHLSHVMTHA